MSAHSSKLSEQDAAVAAEQRRERYSSTQAYRPLRRPETVEDQDACALYAAVRKDGQADSRGDRERLRRAPEDAAPRRQRRRRGRRLRRDDRHPARDLGGGGPQGRPRAAAWRSTRPSPSRTSSCRARRTSSTIKHARPPDPATAAASACSPSARTRSTSAALGPTAREEEPHFWQIGGAGARRRRRATASCSTSRSSSSRSSTLQVASFSAESCVYKVMGAPKVLQGYFDDLRDPRARDRRAARPQPLLDQHVAVVHARAAVLGARATTARSTRSRACARSRACSACRSATTPRTRRTSTA